MTQYSRPSVSVPRRTLYLQDPVRWDATTLPPIGDNLWSHADARRQLRRPADDLYCSLQGFHAPDTKRTVNILSTGGETSSDRGYLHSLFMERTVSAAPLNDLLKNGPRGAKARFAQKLNVSAQVLSNWLARGAIPAGYIPAVARAMSLQSTDDYYRLADPKQKGQINGGNIAKSHMQQTEGEKLLALVKTFLDTDSEGQHEILEAVQSLADSHGKSQAGGGRRRGGKRR